MSANKEETLRHFCDVTGTDENRSRFFLESSNWQLEVALSSFYENGGNVEEAPSASPAVGSVQPMSDSDMDSPPRSPQPKKKEKKKANPNFATLDSLQQESSSEDEDTQAFYAGGSERSGQQILGPGKGRKDIITEMFKSVRERGAVVFEEEPSSTSRGRTGLFGGVGYRLGQTADDHEQVTPGNAAQQQSGRVVRLRLYRAGFAVDDGPLRLYSDPQHAQFLSCIRRGEIPVELRGRGEVRLSLEDRSHEDCPPPATRAAFGGKGQMLGSPTPATVGATGPAVSSDDRDANQRAAQTAVHLDDTAPTTAVQFRLADGSRLTGRFNHSHTVADLIQFVSRAEPAYQLRPFTLLTAFPSTELADTTVTLAQANLLNTTILQRLNPTPATVGATGPAVSSDDRDANQRAAQTAVHLDDTAPTTAVQFRLADGSRLTGRFNHSHTVADLIQFVSRAEPAYQLRPFTLLTAFPSTELADTTVTLAQANLLNTTILQRLNPTPATVGATGPAVSSDDRDANQRAAQTAVHLDDTAPTTAVQFRLADGSRLTGRFNHSHTVADLIQFVSRAEPAYQLRPFTLLTAFPSTELADTTVTLAQANLLNTTILQRLNPTPATVGATGPAVSSDDRDANQRAAQTAVHLDDTAPTTAVQFRLADGSRLTGRFNHSHTVADLIQFVSRAEPAYQLRPFTLLTAFPSTELADTTVTLAQANLLNTTILQRLNPTPATVGATGPAVSSDDRDANQRAAQTAVHLDDTAPTTAVQFRLADGSRLTGRFNHSHTVADLIQFVSRAEPAYQLRPFTLLTAFPSTELADTTVTLAQANLLNTTILQRLNPTPATVGATGPAVSSDDRDANQRAAQTAVHLDDTAPTTAVQFRLADGSRLTGRFNHSHTVADLIQFVSRAEPAYQLRPFTLLTAFPSTELADTTVTLAQANLLNTTILQRLNPTPATVGATGPAVSSDDRDANQRAAQTAVHLDDTAPTTAVQFRLADGSRLTGRFNHSHTVADLIQFVSRAEPAYQLRPFTLLTAFPSTELADTTVTLAQANLLNTTILQRLNPTPATVGATGPAVSSDDRDANQRAAQTAVHLDDTAPTTAVQFRLADGSRLTGRFNHSHTVADLIQFVSRAEPAYQLRPFTLLTAFPSTELADTTVTLAQANLLNTTILQRLK